MIRWFGVQVRKEIKRNVARRINSAGIAYVNQLRENIGKPAPEPSRPGEYPRRDTGELVQSVYFRMDRRSLRFKAGTDTDYSQHIERLRPHLRRTMLESKLSIARAFANG